MYSSIEIEDRSKVIKKCYWPLLKLAEVNEIPMGIELSGCTLEKINEIDSEWVKKFKKLLIAGKIELIGSGYAQIIGPLVPAKVNDWNQRLGLEIYENILGIRPRIALVNEMAYSGGIVEHYINNNFDAIIMEWNNPRRYHPEWKNDWRYFPQYAVAAGASNRNIPLIWADSIAFQKFQRYAQGELGLEEYIEYLKGNYNKDENRYFPVYANDVEIFDFRPNRYNTEIEINKQGEWSRIETFFSQIKQSNSFKLIKPSKVLLGLSEKNAGNKLKLESPEQPIPVKKQEKYNINRWAVTGRDDLGINTKCYQIYNSFIENNNTRFEDWKQLCYLWSSDFRTHITQKRWDAYKKRLNDFKKKWVDEKINIDDNKKTVQLPYKKKDKDISIIDSRKFLTIETKVLRCSLNKFKGLTIDKLWFKEKSKEPLIGTLSHGYYDDISFGADFYSGHAIIEKPGQHKFTNLSKGNHFISYDSESIIISCENIDRDVWFNKKYKVYFNECCMEIFYEIIIPRRDIAIIHPLNITFIPTSFDKDTLFYATHNGGRKIEKFEVKDNIINHAQSLSSLISAKQGLGATEGVVVVGDDRKQISFWHDQTMSSLIPSIHYLPVNNNQYFLRLQYSAQEIDETFIKNREVQKLESCWKINLWQDE
ncbi:MAG: glycoside hydrolase family 57 [Candidatus Omnitrophota bacterium]|nr:MAG: glycoside hydrolase family 57 [Candidatus Omnitrophota bacterium]